MQVMNLIDTTNISEYGQAGGSYQSPANQEILRRLVGREVIYCVSYLISELYQKDPDDEDLMNLFRSEPDWEDAFMQNIDQIDNWKQLARYVDVDYETAYHDEDEENEDFPQSEENARKAVIEHAKGDMEACKEICDFENIDGDDYCYEVYEHWIVTDWLARKLADRGHVTGDAYGLTIWGRGCTGQAIYLDHVIGEIAAEMQILEGQKYDWSKKD